MGLSGQFLYPVLALVFLAALLAGVNLGWFSMRHVIALCRGLAGLGLAALIAWAAWELAHIGPNVQPLSWKDEFLSWSDWHRPSRWLWVIAVIVAAWSLFALWSLAFHSKAPDELPVDTADPAKAPLQDLHNQLRRRAGRRRNLGYFCLFIIASALIAGGVFYYFAPQLSQQETAERFSGQRALLEKALEDERARATQGDGTVKRSRASLQTYFAALNANSEWQRGWASSIYDIAVIDENIAVAVGSDGGIARTEDGGKTWTAQESKTGSDLRSVAFVDASRGWAVGDGGTILVTQNGGADWTRQESKTGSYLLSVAFVDASRGWAVGDGGTILVTQNGGADWTAQESKTSRDLLSVAFVDASRGWAVGEGGRVYALTMPDMTPFEAAQTTAEMDKVFSDTGQRGNVPDELFQSYRAAKLAASQGKTAVEQYEQSLAQLSDGLVSKQGWEGIDWNANLNRIGVMAFLLFFVTILVSLYRYSMRMAAFYDSRADSLMLLLAWGDSAPGKIQDLDGAVKAISPDTYDFGKPPKNPVDQSIELAAKILDATKRRG